MAIQHNTITDPNIHEPKGVSTATDGQVYKADGAGSGTWTSPLLGQDTATAGQVFISDGANSGEFVGLYKYSNVYVNFDPTTPAYSVATTTSDQLLDPSFTQGENLGFTLETAPNFRLKYTDDENISSTINLTIATKQSSGSDKDCEWAVFKNGTEVPGSRVIRTLSTGGWGSITLTCATSFVTNDYIEIKTKASGSATVDYASIQLTLQGHKE